LQRATRRALADCNISALALSALHHVVASSLSSVDVKNLPGHKLRAIQVEHRVYNVGHILPSDPLDGAPPTLDALLAGASAS
jgi:hypothetical protein